MRLVLEGGGVRAAYSAGVCLALERAQLDCRVVIGSSSGCINAAFVAAGQSELLCEQWPAIVPGPRFINWGRQFNPFAGPGLGVDTLIDDVLIGAGILDPVKATSGPMDLLITATDVDTIQGVVGRPTADSLALWMKASLALPAAYNKVVSIDGRGFIDGGVATPVPFDEPELNDYEGPTVVVLTRPIHTEKPRPTWWQRALIHTMVPKSARAATLSQHLLHRSVIKRLKAAKALGDDKGQGGGKAHGDVIVSEPPPHLPISRLTKDPARIRAGIELGVLEGQRLAQEIVRRRGSDS